MDQKSGLVDLHSRKGKGRAAQVVIGQLAPPTADRETNHGITPPPPQHRHLLYNLWTANH